MNVHPDMQSKCVVCFLLTYWFDWIIISQELGITPECLEKPLFLAEPNDDVYLDSFSDSYLHPLTCGTFIGTEMTLYLIVEYSSAKILAEDLSSRAISSLGLTGSEKKGLNLLTRKPITHLLVPT